MGNSPSSIESDHKGFNDNLNVISKPNTLLRRVSAQERRSHTPAETGSSTSNNMLAPPSQVSGHRRSRSANASARGSSYIPPPPPYSPNPPLDSIPPPPPPKEGDTNTGFESVPGSSTSGHVYRRSASYLQTPMRKRTEEDALETLKKYDTILVVDDSSSMIGARWTEATVALAALADKAGQYDTDGIDIYFLNASEIGRNMKNSRDVQNLFRKVRPKGATPIGAKLEYLLRNYMHKIEMANKAGPMALNRIKPINFVIITDGAPTDDPESVIIHTARRLDAGNFPVTQVGIQFVQIGDSRQATEYLQELDDGLSGKHKIRDIVDTTPYICQLNGDSLIKILLGGINRRVDTRGASAVS